MYSVLYFTLVFDRDFTAWFSELLFLRHIYFFHILFGLLVPFSLWTFTSFFYLTFFFHSFFPIFFPTRFQFFFISCSILFRFDFFFNYGHILDFFQFFSVLYSELSSTLAIKQNCEIQKQTNAIT